MSRSTQLLTYEEQRTPIYTTSDEPTVPASVDATTPLGQLNLNWRERDLPERERTKHVHRLHPYLGKYIPQLVEVFLRKYFAVGQTVLDPFCGSGTTLVQSSELGIHSVGVDVSAFNVLLAKAKTKHYKIKTVQREILDILQKVYRAIEIESDVSQLTLWSVNKSEKNGTATNASIASAYLQTWFAPRALQELLMYRSLIPNYEDQDILKVILSRAARSARLTTHFDLDFPKKPQTEPYFCYKHDRMCMPTDTAIQFLKRYSIDTTKRLEAFATTRTNANVCVLHADSRTVDLPKLDGVLTSPPYVGLIDYHEQHRYAYELLGLENRSTSEIGAASDGSSQKAQRAYQQNIAQVFSHVCQALRKGGRLIVVAGDKHDLYDEIADLCGVEVEAVLRRHVNRRTGRRATEFYESIFIWRKP